jgi:glycosyltransferase involved in cell wall biosynthesis
MDASTTVSDTGARRDVAIYSPRSVHWYERSDSRGGGAERQMMLLARALAARGTRVAHIVLQPRDPVPVPPGLTLVARAPESESSSLVGGLREAVRVWRGLGAADARVTIVRMATPALGVAGLWCRLRRRRLVFSSANDSDFMKGAGPDRLPTRLLYRLGLRLADAVVVQSRDQVRLARESLPRLRAVVTIPSFCEPAGEVAGAPAEPEAFLWIGRLTAEKSPQRFLDLAGVLPEARFVLIPVPGSAAPVDSSEVREAARELQNLTVSDPLPHRELMGLVSRAAAVVNTSSVEGMPNVFLEAWARGVPVLTLHCDPDGVVAARGLGVAADGSWDRFVAGARELWDTRRDRAELARRTRAYIEEVHSIDAVAARWADVLEKVAR